MAEDHEYGNEPGSEHGHPFNGSSDASAANRIPLKKTYHISPLRQLYLATLGTARQIRIDEWVGNFESGKEADFVVLDLAPSPLLQRRREVILSRTKASGKLPLQLQNVADSLFGLTTVPTDRTIFKTFVAGELLYSRAVNYEQSLDADYTERRVETS